jgi:hypothetical protein
VNAPAADLVVNVKSQSNRFLVRTEALSAKLRPRVEERSLVPGTDTEDCNGPTGVGTSTEVAAKIGCKSAFSIATSPVGADLELALIAAE